MFVALDIGFLAMKTKLKPIKLRTIFAILLGIGVLSTVVFVYIGTVTFLDIETKKLTAKLSPESKKTFEDLQKGVVGDGEKLAALQRESFKLQKEKFGSLEDPTDKTVLEFSIAALLVWVLMGIFLSSFLSKPILSVAEAARKIANGKIDARAKHIGFESQETAQLVEDFNFMAQNLERLEKEYKYSNAAIAHELRTPLTILRGRLQGLKDNYFTPSEAEFSILISQTETLARIVEDLKTLSLSMSQKLILNYSWADLSDIISETLDFINPNLEALGFKIEFELQSISTYVDKDRLKQALLAAMQNVKIHASDGKYLKISVSKTKKNALITILDKGPGLPDEKLALAAERFWRNENSRSRDFGGTGLGLSVINAIVTAHKGNFNISNNKPNGLKLEIILPILNSI